MKYCPVQDAKARFSELLETCLKDGPQIVTERGAKMAVLAPIAEWGVFSSARGRVSRDRFSLRRRVATISQRAGPSPLPRAEGTWLTHVAAGHECRLGTAPT